MQAIDLNPAPPTPCAESPGRVSRTWAVASETADQRVMVFDVVGTEELAPDDRRHTLVLNGEPAIFPKAEGDDSSRRNAYKPHFLVAKTGTGHQFTSLLPIVIQEGANTFEMRSPQGVEPVNVRLLPVLEGIEASIAFSGHGVQRVYFPGDAPAATVTLRAEPGSLLEGTLTVQQLRLIDGKPQRWSDPQDRVTDIGHAAEQAIDVTVPAGGEVTLEMPIPDDAYGTYHLALVLRDGDGLLTEALGGIAVVPRRDETAFRPGSAFMVSTDRVHERTGAPACPAFKRLGFDWYRTEVGWDLFQKEPGSFDWAVTDALHDSCRKSAIFTMDLASHSPVYARPQMPPDAPIVDRGEPSDSAPDEAHLPDWQEAWRAYMERYKDVHRAINVWNEPWEGGGISHWRSTAAYYRKLVRGVRNARDLVDPTIPVVAADSGDNTAWKMFAAGCEDDLDISSIHYEKPDSCSAFATARHYDKRVWDTETWLAHEGDNSVIRLLLHEMSLGTEKVSLWMDGMLFGSDGSPTPGASAVAAAAHLLRDLCFECTAHPARPPFVLVFSSEGRQLAAITTCLTGADNAPFAQFADDRVLMSVDLPADTCHAYDLYANRIDCADEDGTVRLPVDRDVRWLEHTGEAEHFVTALNRAEYDGLRPVSITVHDLDAPVPPRSVDRDLRDRGHGCDDRVQQSTDAAGDHPHHRGVCPALRVRLRNAYAAPMSGTVRVESETLTFAGSAQPFELGPSTTEEVSFPVSSGAACPENSYPVRVVVETELGTAEWQENVHVAVIARGPHSPIPVHLGTGNREQNLAATFDPAKPWEGVARQSAEFAAEGVFTAEDEALHVLVRVADPDAGSKLLPSLLAGKNLHRFQMAPAEHNYLQAGPRPAYMAPALHLALGRAMCRRWSEMFEVFPPEHPQRPFAAHYSTDYEYIAYPIEGGGAEVLRLRTPDFFYLHAMPTDYAWIAEHCRVEGASIQVDVREGEGMLYRLSLPWTELGVLPHACGDRIRMSFRIKRGGRDMLEWSHGRSAAGCSSLDWSILNGKSDWGAATEWTFR